MYCKTLQLILIKAIFTRKLGYEYEIWIFDNKKLINVL